MQSCSHRPAQNQISAACCAVFSDENIPWFDITMDNAFLVYHLQALSDLYCNVDSFLQFEGITLDPLLQRLTLITGHGDEGPTVLSLIDLMDITDIGMIES